MKIELNDLDTLFAISSELGVIIYLQFLLDCDNICPLIHDDSLSFARKYTLSYLQEKQYASVLQFRDLLEQLQAKNKPTQAATG